MTTPAELGLSCTFGIDAFLADVLPGLADLPARVIVNLFGETRDAYRELAARVEDEPAVAAIELNVSCPNVDRGGIEFGMQAPDEWHAQPLPDRRR